MYETPWNPNLESTDQQIVNPDSQPMEQMISGASSGKGKQPAQDIDMAVVDLTLSDTNQSTPTVESQATPKANAGPSKQSAKQTKPKKTKDNNDEYDISILCLLMFNNVLLSNRDAPVRLGDFTSRFDMEFAQWLQEDVADTVSVNRLLKNKEMKPLLDMLSFKNATQWQRKLESAGLRLEPSIAQKYAEAFERFCGLRKEE